MIEVEVKAKIDNFEDIKVKLNQINAVKTKTEEQIDRYFNSPVKDFAETDEALRIRETKTEDSHNLFSDKCSKIFENLGFKEVRTVKKNREYFKLDNFEISLDDVEGLEPYMEIEIALEDGTDYNEAQDKIFDLFKELGITDGFERTSYLELLENLDK